jgi:glutamate synthase domain-containing protein 1
MRKIFQRIPGACGLIGIIDKRGRRFSGKEVIKALEPMRPRYNGLGAGFAIYGIYPKYQDYYALHTMFFSDQGKEQVDAFLAENISIIHDEKIPTRKVKGIAPPPILWRYFVEPKNGDDEISRIVMKINSEFEDAYIVSSGKNLGVFKGVGYPDQIAEFYGIEDYKGYIWLGHGRYPTNTPGWWGGAHPFNILGWSIIHNGEISSYGTNKRYVESWDYKCTLMTDSEVLAYLFDLLVRRHRLPLTLACTALTPPFWSQIDLMKSEEQKLLEAIRIAYADALVNGPFSIVVATTHGTDALFGLTDRIKLRPLIAAENGSRGHIASEECAIRAICPKPESIWHLKAGIPTIFPVIT